MSLERSENFIVRLNGKNYSAWAFQFELFVKGKELWSHINGSDSAPDKEKEKEKYAKWEVKDAQIMSWILGSVEPSIFINLKPYKTSRGMWDYLKKVYIQNNSARRFQLELELGQLSQGSMSIQEFYSSFETLWVEYTDIVYANVPPEGLSAVQSVHETSKRDQFLMKLRGEFETIRSNLMNRQLVPSMDICVGELLREEQRLTTLAVLEQKAQNSAPIPSTITPEMVQQMIVSALSAFGLSGNNNSDSKPWYFDSGASHHMTNTALPLKNVQKYSGDLQIHTADGNSLPITAVGDISASLNNVFVSPKLSTNLISVGQLVDSNCTVQFSKSGCFVQDQVSGKMIAKGPKVGRLFPLFLSPPLVSNYVACNAVQSLTSAPSHQPATTDSVLPSSIDPPPLRRSSRPHKPVESTGVSDKYGLDNFPRLYAGLRIVNSALFSADTANEALCFQGYPVENISRMLYRVGVQQLSAHEIIKMHILPSFSDGQHTLAHNELMTDYLSFLMFHLQSNCPICHMEKNLIIGELRNKALILTNHGYKRCAEVPIHFSKEYENPIDMKQLVVGISVEWLEVHNIYLKHPITQLLPGGISKWRNFFMELGITDFVQIVQVEKSIADLSPIVLQNITWDKDLISGGSNVKDWESTELVHLLSQLSANHDKEKSKHLLEILDSLWDDCFSDKVKGFFFSSNGEKKVFESSFASSLCNTRWIVSRMDDELHHPKDLFYDCEAVHSILGAFAPYAVPKVWTRILNPSFRPQNMLELDEFSHPFQWLPSKNFDAVVSCALRSRQRRLFSGISESGPEELK
nr:uncharacterized protein LOC109178973 isoform X2 [Ipomoea batatas]